MKNVQMAVAGNVLTIIIASTEGNIAVPEREEKIGLNVYRKK